MRSFKSNQADETQGGHHGNTDANQIADPHALLLERAKRSLVT